MFHYNGIVTLFLFIAFQIALFLALRSVFLWYTKINTRVTLLEENNKLLEQILSELRNKEH